MKTSKSPEDTEVTPSKKKLKQARLPFKIISEVSPSPVATPSTRKRKLSSPEDESVTKATKISKENDTVLISDDDSKDGNNAQKTEQKIPNPYIKLVDTAWKKKLQKSKGAKKKKSKKKGTTELAENGSVETGSDTADDKAGEDCEMMDVDEAEQNDYDKKDSQQELNKKTENNVNKSLEQDRDIVVLDDSNNSSDVKQVVPDNSSLSKIEKDAEDENKTTDTISANTNENDTEKSQVIDKDQTNKESESSKESPETSDCDNVDKCPEKKEIKIVTTPKRSARNKAKHEENNNSKGSPSSSSNLDESMTSDPTTPKQNRSSSVKLDESVTESTPSSNLTPKQLQKRLDSVKKREEREKEKQEREKKRQQEKEERAKQKLEKEEQRKREREEKEEAKRKEKEEKEEQKKKEKEEKEKQKELEKKQREEKEEQKRKEKEEKEEQKRKEREAREEERRKKQEALELEKQEQELKKKKTAEAFASFFVPKQKVEKDQPTVGSVSNNMLSSFTLKSDMRLAPTTRNSLTEERAQELERFIKDQNVKKDDLYLSKLRNGISKPLSSGRTWPKDDDDVILVEDELPPLDGAGEIITCEPAVREKLRPKLLSFDENRRPPYWGTWRKKSKFIKPRKPFGQDEKQLDYDVDSDDDWEEEQEGESIDGSAAGSDDEQGPDEYEVDNEVFVPHGYLSDEEATMDDDDVLSLSPETQKARLKHLEDEFESEMKKPTEKLKPRLYGILWENSDGGKPDNCVDALWNYFGKFAMVLNDPTPYFQPSQENNETEKKKVKKKKISSAATTAEEEHKSPKSEKKKKKGKHQDKESKPNPELKKNLPEIKKNQLGINMFLTKMKSTET